jgi:hypothetical protein
VNCASWQLSNNETVLPSLEPHFVKAKLLLEVDDDDDDDDLRGRETAFDVAAAGARQPQAYRAFRFDAAATHSARHEAELARDARKK